MSLISFLPSVDSAPTGGEGRLGLEAWSDPGVDEFMEFLAVERNASPRTLINYQHALREYRTRVMGFSGWEAATADDFRGYLFAQMKRKLSRATIRLHFAALRSYYTFLTRRKNLPVNPLLGVQLPKLEKKLPGC